MRKEGLWRREAKLVLQRAAGGCRSSSEGTSSGLGVRGGGTTKQLGHPSTLSLHSLR